MVWEKNSRGEREAMEVSERLFGCHGWKGDNAAREGAWAGSSVIREPMGGGSKENE